MRKLAHELECWNTCDDAVAARADVHAEIDGALRLKAACAAADELHVGFLHESEDGGVDDNVGLIEGESGITVTTRRLVLLNRQRLGEARLREDLAKVESGVHVWARHRFSCLLIKNATGDDWRRALVVLDLPLRPFFEAVDRDVVQGPQILLWLIV